MPHTAITLEGGLFGPDLLESIATAQAEGQRPEDFGLRSGARLPDAIQEAFSYANTEWQAFQRRLSYGRESTTTLTRQTWMRPLLEDPLNFRLVRATGTQAGGQSYDISDRAGDELDAPPVHIVAVDQALGQRAERSRRSPHSTVQEYLNRSDALWGIVTNGESLRILRNSTRISRPVYIEFDLRAMIEQNLYSEFVVLYRLVHRSRFPHSSADAHQCLLERYYQQGIEQGDRVREHLRDGVTEALRELGTAFLAHPRNQALRDAFDHRFTEQDYYRELLRLIYRLLFLMVVEDRKLLFLPDAPNATKQQLYSRYYGLSRLRDRAERFLLDDHQDDLWQGLRRVFQLFRDSDRAQRLGLSALNGELFGEQACPHLEQAVCENRELLRAIYRLSTFEPERGIRRRVNFAALDVEEFGSVYESLLDFKPSVQLTGKPTFDLLAGTERRETGSHYTPPELVQPLIEAAVVPVMEERLAAARTNPEKQQALLDLKICDPAAGSGHFLLAAARRVARELARLRSGEEEPSLEVYRAALRDVIRQCIYAVDKNPLAVDLCKVALWIEGYNAGLPLSFLDHHVKCGNSLIGVNDLAVLEEGIPDEAYQPVTDDDRHAGSLLKQQNKLERGKRLLGGGFAGQIVMDLPSSGHGVLPELSRQFEELSAADDRTPADVHAKEQRYELLRGRGSSWWDTKVACDLWTSAFFSRFQMETDYRAVQVSTTETVRSFLKQPAAAYAPLVGKAVGLAQELGFFHWPLEFPEVFDGGGFDAVVGNPPFLGGTKISTVFGDKYRVYLASMFVPAGHTADLCAYFCRHDFRVLRPGGRAGVVAVNTISQGDTRSGGLAHILSHDGRITFARRFVKWPGTANVEVTLLGLANGHVRDKPLLDGAEVAVISSRLDTEPEAESKALDQNFRKAFQGFKVDGMGFVMTAAKAQSLIASNAVNRDCLFPFLNGEDLNSEPDFSPPRWVINFFDWPESRAGQYKDLFQIVENKVRPARALIKRTSNREKWWQYGENRPGLKRAIATMHRVLVRTIHSELHMMAFVPNGWVYSHALVIFAFEHGYHFALLQSNVHEAWVRRNASTIRTDIRYTPTDCFETFAFPQDPSREVQGWADRVGGEYHEYRRQVMLERELGLTKTYNLFNNPACSDSDIQKLRELHQETDQAILACYGWDDLDPGHSFHKNDRGQTRFTISPEARKEILRRLIELNLELASAGREPPAKLAAAGSA